MTLPVMKFALSHSLFTQDKLLMSGTLFGWYTHVRNLITRWGIII